ncbi:hypothetical protein EDC04DRAFT_2894620 [Pisolithus marmoratus]|nr:hypothetical protein EDC04DRAFT_2894620 [Pisolithus marmoratus]
MHPTSIDRGSISPQTRLIVSPTPLSFALLTPPNVIRDLIPFDTFQREAHVLDTIRTREDLFMDVSRLHLGRDELFKDLFDLM